MGYAFPRKRQRPEKWEPTAKELATAEKAVFNSRALVLINMGYVFPRKGQRPEKWEPTAKELATAEKEVFNSRAELVVLQEKPNPKPADFSTNNKIDSKPERLWRSAVDYGSKPTAKELAAAEKAAFNSRVELVVLQEKPNQKPDVSSTNNKIDSKRERMWRSAVDYGSKPTTKELATAEKAVINSRAELVVLQEKPNQKPDVSSTNNKIDSKHERMWRSAVDYVSNETYYYHRKTRERSAKKPPEILRYEQDVKTYKGDLEVTRRPSLLQINNDTANTIMTVDDPKTPMNEIEVMDLTTLSVEDFSTNFRENSEECLTDVYEIDYTVHKSKVSGTLSIPLPQDVFHLVETQLSLLDEYLVRAKLKRTVTGDRLLVDCVLSILRNISKKQSHYRDKFLQDGLASCVAAANSFSWMAEKVDEFMETVQQRYCHLQWSDADPVTWMACQEAMELGSQFSTDAVIAASNDGIFFIMDDMHDARISSLLFTHQWEEELVNNEVSVAMTKILEKNISQVSKWMEQDFLFHKFIGALVRATICFYIEGLVQKADKLRSAGSTLGKKAAKRKIAFRNPRQACVRLSDDIEVLQDYFQDTASENTFLTRVVSKEFSILILLVECMLQAAKHANTESLEEFAFAIHKETGANSDVTKYFLSDLWLLMGRKGQHLAVEDAISKMDEDLQIFAQENLTSPSSSNTDVTCFRLDAVLKTLYKERRRSEKSMITIAEESLKKTRKEIKKELKSRELRVKYFLEDLEDDFSALNGRQSTRAEF
jgi:hypothetical protein